MNLTEISDVIKASPAIQVQSKMSLLQRRAWNVLLANAYNELPDKEIHSVSMVELAAKLGFDSKNDDYLKEMLESIIDFKVKWNILGKDKKQEWGVAHLLAEVRIHNGICFYQFPHTLRLKLHNPRVYAKLNLRLQNQFKSQYALVLWEVCFDYFDADRGKGETPFIPLETYRELMGVEADEYTTFKSLNQWVIKPAIKEINDLTNYHVEVVNKRLGRKIAELKFRITRVKQAPIQESVFPDVDNLPPIAIELAQSGIDRDIALQIADQQWDCVNPNKMPMPGTYPEFLEYISEKIEMSLYASTVTNRPGYIIEAIRGNYQNTKVQEEREARAERAKEQELEDLTKEYYVKRNNILRQAVHTDPELVGKAAERITSYIVRQRLVDHDSAMEAYQQGGMVASEINEVLAAEFCQDLLAPVVSAYEEEKARILGAVG